MKHLLLTEAQKEKEKSIRLTYLHCHFQVYSWVWYWEFSPDEELQCEKRQYKYIFLKSPDGGIYKI